MIIDFMPSSEAEEIRQNVASIVETVKGSAPLALDFGVDHPQDKTGDVFVSQLANRAMLAVELYEPRVSVTRVDVVVDEHGKFKPVITYTMRREGDR